MKRSILCGVIAAGVLAATGASAYTNLILNGSFESTSIGSPTPTAIWVAAGNSTTITDWTVGCAGGGGCTNPHAVRLVGTYWQAEDGVQSVGLRQNSSVSQTFATTVGDTYLATFWLAGDSAVAPNIKAVGVSVSGNPAGTDPFDTESTSPSAMGWVKETYAFTAIIPNTTITFTGYGIAASGTPNTPGYFPGVSGGAAIDNVSVYDTSSVPEPATWAVMLVGLGMVGYGLRRRGALANAA